MPYIKLEYRPQFEQDLTALFVNLPENPGELNYVITRLISEYWRRDRKYATIAEISGVLSNVESEFYRRIAVPYEDTKIAENGDVY